MRKVNLRCEVFIQLVLEDGVEVADLLDRSEFDVVICDPEYECDVVDVEFIDWEIDYSR